ncbi:hypothetical protein PPYR_03091 [Photinus pyralis]|uniref:CRAL-TRIO domain-containing protein n=2 Tax=Photinus pyralis TaxID=7054 RepID=A0A5N4A1X0_PHOPY|nr:retinol-binding protein pinta-like [Photinus pyralis]XP_031331287.1 retinol-binding protein pinta-like [Photinus pyralis]KAB0791291.1 hypothetical protein PPYR_03091 [Photinus pyralis]
MPLNYADVPLQYAKRKYLHKEDVEYLKSWMGKQPHLPQLSDLEVIFALFSCNCKVEATKTTIDNYFTLRGMLGEVFGPRDMETWRRTLDAITILPLPKLTPEGYQIFCWKLNDRDPSKYVFADAVKYLETIIKMTILQQGTLDGLIGVVDMEGFSLTHLARINPMLLKNLIVFVQALPIMLEALHFINAGTRLDKLLTLMKPVIKKEIFEMIHIHSDYRKTLYKSLPLHCMPKEYGGLLGSVQEMRDDMVGMILNNMDFIADEERKVVDESKRPHPTTKINELFGIEGTFKKLEID